MKTTLVSRLKVRAMWLVLAALVSEPLTAQQIALGVDITSNAGPFRFQIGRHVTYVCPATDIPPGVSV